MLYGGKFGPLFLLPPWLCAVRPQSLPEVYVHFTYCDLFSLGNHTCVFTWLLGNVIRGVFKSKAYYLGILMTKEQTKIMLK